jgi:hypothetical protein
LTAKRPEASRGSPVEDRLQCRVPGELQAQADDIRHALVDDRLDLGQLERVGGIDLFADDLFGLGIDVKAEDDRIRRMDT